MSSLKIYYFKVFQLLPHGALNGEWCINCNL